jgi:predicted RNA polymerase sigma factor
VAVVRHEPQRLVPAEIGKRVVDLQQTTATGQDVEEDAETLGMEDDRVRLIFACCHPALALEVRVALTLRYVAGLTTREIAAAFLQPEPTLAQRLVRAKRKIRQAGIGFEVPGPQALAARLAGVQGVITWCSTRGMRPVAAIGLSEGSCARRRSGWGGCCTGCYRPTPRPPGCLR